MKLTPLQDWAVIVPSEAEARTAGGLYIPDTAKEKPAEGVVEDIGPGALEEEGYGKKKKEKKDRKFIPTTVKPGERVLYEQFAGQKVTLGSEERVLVRERNILGVISGGAAKPLQIPEKTSSPEQTSIATLAMTAITAVGKTAAKKGQGASSKGQGKAKKKAAKKAAKKKGPAKPKKAAKKQGQGSSGKGKGKRRKHQQRRPSRRDKT